LFVGASLSGGVIGSRPDANEAFYGYPVSADAILGGQVRPPRAAAPLIDALANIGYGGGPLAQR